MARPQSPMSKLEESAMNLKAILDDAIEGKIDAIEDHLDEYERGDHRNDKIRRSQRQYMLLAKRACKRRDIAAAEKYIDMVIKRGDEADEEDLQDDKPRLEARIELAALKNALTRASEEVWRFLGQLNQ